jgi:DNA-binding CsgD family transcriptional regulator
VDKLRHAKSADALLTAAASPDPTLLAWARCEIVSSRLLAGEGLDIARLDEALALERHGRVPTAEDEVATIRPVLLKWDDRLEEALDALHELRDLAQAEGNEGVIPYVVGHESAVLLRLGRWREAERAVTEHDEWAAATGQSAQHLQAAYNRAHLALHIGDRDRAKRAIVDIRAASQTAGAGSWELMSLAGVTGALAVLEEDWTTAAATLDGWYEAMNTAGIKEPGISRFHGDYIEALVAVKRYDDAEKLTTDLLELANRLSRPAVAATGWRGRALLAAAHGALREALGFLNNSLAAERLRPVPVERGRSLLVTGTVHRRMRAKRAARDAFGEAVETFRGAGATGWADRAERELARTGLRQRAAADLTETERRVAELASEGLTNRQIAQSAFISLKTVEANLGRIYRKLGISSRAQLGLRIAAERAKHG